MNRKQAIYLAAVPVIVVLNYLTSVATDLLQIPFYLDTWATSLGVMAAGLGAGMAGGIAYNLIMAATVWGWPMWVWGFSSAWVGLATYLLYKRGWIDLGNPYKLIASGILIGLSNAMVSTIISVIAFGSLPTYAGTEPTYTFFYNLTGNRLAGLFGEHILSELADKTVAVFMAALAFSWLPRRLK